jgi:hypothetical protein
LCSRMLGDVEVDDLASLVPQHEEHVENRNDALGTVKKSIAASSVT